VTNPRELLSKRPVLGGFSNLLDLRQSFWQTLKNCCPKWPFLRGFPSPLVMREMLDQLSISLISTITSKNKIILKLTKQSPLIIKKNVKYSIM